VTPGERDATGTSRNAAGGTAAAAAPAVPPPPTPEEVAQQAYEKLSIPLPVMHFGPDAEHVAVNFWTVLWVDNPGKITATATAGAVSVTAIAAFGVDSGYGLGAAGTVLPVLSASQRATVDQ